MRAEKNSGWQDLSDQTARMLEPMVRTLVEWMKQTDNEGDESLSYVQKSDGLDNYFKPSLI